MDRRKVERVSTDTVEFCGYSTNDDRRFPEMEVHEDILQQTTPPPSMSSLAISSLIQGEASAEAFLGSEEDLMVDADVSVPGQLGNRPPTPAPSPVPEDSGVTPSWGVASAEEDYALRAVRGHFAKLKTDERQRFLTELLNMCTSYELASVSAYVSPRLKKDFLKYLPVELSLRVIGLVRWVSTQGANEIRS